MVYVVYFTGLIAGFILAAVLSAYELSKCLKTGNLLGGRYQIIDHGNKEKNEI